MKKAGILIILSVFLIGILAGVVNAENSYQTWLEKMTAKNPQSQTRTTTESAKGVFSSVIGIFGSVLGSLFKAINDEPGGWLRFLIFIAICATMFRVLKIKAVAGILDDKTAGILSFVIAFATAAVMPENWLFYLVYMYGGLTLIIALAIPLLIGFWQTKELITKEVSKPVLAVLLIAWAAYLFLIWTIYATISTAVTNTLIETVLLVITLAVTVIMVILGIKLISFRSETEKAGRPHSPTEETKEKKRDDKKKNEKEVDFDTINNLAKEVTGNLQVAVKKAKQPPVDACQGAINMAAQALSELAENMPSMDYLVDETKKMGVTKEKDHINRNKIKEINGDISQIEIGIGQTLKKIKTAKKVDSARGEPLDTIYPEMDIYLVTLVQCGNTIEDNILDIIELYEKTKELYEKTKEEFEESEASQTPKRPPHYPPSGAVYHPPSGGRS